MSQKVDGTVARVERSGTRVASAAVAGQDAISSRLRFPGSAIAR